MKPPFERDAAEPCAHIARAINELFGAVNAQPLDDAETIIEITLIELRAALNRELSRPGVRTTNRIRLGYEPDHSADEQEP